VLLSFGRNSQRDARRRSARPTTSIGHADPRRPRARDGDRRPTSRACRRGRRRRRRRAGRRRRPGSAPRRRARGRRAASRGRPSRRRPLQEHFLARDAEPSAAHAAVREELGHDERRRVRGDAKHRPCAPRMIAVLMPTTRPAESRSGPPEFPGFSGASVWITPSIILPAASLRSVRPSALTMPSVTVRASPNGDPTAIAKSPTRRPLLSPSVACRERAGEESRERDVRRRIVPGDVGDQRAGPSASSASTPWRRGRRGCS